MDFLFLNWGFFYPKTKEKAEVYFFQYELLKYKTGKLLNQFIN
jgi:hypothetical protein